MFVSSYTNRLVNSLAGLPLLYREDQEKTDGCSDYSNHEKLDNFGKSAKRFIVLSKQGNCSIVNNRKKAASLEQLSKKINQVLPQVSKKLAELEKSWVNIKVEKLPKDGAISNEALASRAKKIEELQTLAKNVATLKDFKKKAIVINAKIHEHNKAVDEQNKRLKKKNIIIRFFSKVFGKKKIKEIDRQYLCTVRRKLAWRAQAIGAYKRIHKNAHNLKIVGNALQTLSTDNDDVDRLMEALISLTESFGSLCESDPKAIVKVRDHLKQTTMKPAAKPEPRLQNNPVSPGPSDLIPQVIPTPPPGLPPPAPVFSPPPSLAKLAKGFKAQGRVEQREADKLPKPKVGNDLLQELILSIAKMKAKKDNKIQGTTGAPKTPVQVPQTPVDALRAQLNKNRPNIASVDNSADNESDDDWD